MAIFKVGQRVRILTTPTHSWEDEGAIVAYDSITHANAGFVWVVRADNHPRYGASLSGEYPGCWWCHPAFLAPLTDDKADAFIERIKQMKPYEEPLRAGTYKVRT